MKTTETQNAFKIKDSELAHLRKECELIPGAIELLGNDRNALVDTINAVCVRVKAIEDAFRLLEESPIDATQEEIGDEEFGDEELLEEIGGEELLEFIEMAKQLVSKQYYFPRRVHNSINCLLDPLGQDSVAIGVDSIAVASPACSAVSCIAIGDARAAVGSLKGAAPSGQQSAEKFLHACSCEWLLVSGPL